MKSTAYISAEIGFSVHVPTYSGGLGVLAGDHLKSAADAGLPVVGVTLLYREGYFVQHLDVDGVQTAAYPRFDPAPRLEKLDRTVVVAMSGRQVELAVWRTTLVGHGGGRVPILFLDSDLDSNAPEDRVITYRLYGGGERMRLRQEVVLGFGGLRAVETFFPEIERYHLNEGHCAFLPFALLSDGVARDDVRARCHFTTHTPVPAGHDRFDYEMAREILCDLLDSKPSMRDLAGEELLSMSHLALNTCGTANGVSELHGEVSRDMFPDHDIAHITNGVHHLSWISRPIATVLDRHLRTWRKDPSVLAQAPSLPDDELLAAHAQRKAELLEVVNGQSNRGFAQDLLTIGFGRRAAPYKRATLLFSSLERLVKIAGGRVQFVFSGKAHPRDYSGQRVIQDVIRAARDLGEDVRVCYLPNYNMWTGALLTSGVDVWLNTPRRPREASGTSGMKAALNGVPNASISDGWWAEGAEHGVNGWVIGDADDNSDEADAAALYSLMEEEIIPAYADPERWVTMMKAAIATGARFTSARMLRDYAERYYR